MQPFRQQLSWLFRATKKNYPPVGTEQTTDDGVERSHWAKADIPNSVANIRRLYEERYGATRAGDTVIEATHYYVRFEPETEEEFYAISADENIDVYYHPLDCEIPEGSTSYIDPEQPLDKPQFLFAIIAADYVPACSSNYTVLAGIVRGTLPELLLDWGKTPDVPDPNTHIPPTDWTNSTKLKGCIRVWDDEFGRFLGIEGVKVKVSNWLYGSDTAITGPGGYFIINKSFPGNVDWQIIWEGEFWNIRDGDLPQAYYNRGGNTRNNWMLDMDNGKSLRYATIHRAAYRYFKGDTGGLKRPALSSNPKLNMSYHDYSGVSIHNSSGIIGFLSQVHLYKSYPNHPDYQTSMLFAVACHEMAHASHCYHMGSSAYWTVENYICESWAKFVQWHMVMLEYRARGLSQAKLNTLNDNYAKQRWPSSQPEKDYTPIFIDLVDDLNQRIVNNDSSLPTDNVTGYTAGQLNNILFHSYGSLSLISTLKANKPAGVTNTQLDDLFVVYDNKFFE